jgi:Sulfotransferase family
MPWHWLSALDPRLQAGECVTPILLCGQDRSGGTALMKLFASSSAVFCDRDYPYEKRYLTYFAKLAELLARGEPPDPFSDRELLDFNESAFGGFPWRYSKAYQGADWPPRRTDWLRAFWQGYTCLAGRSSPAARYYAEKAPPWLGGVVREAMPAEMVYLFRDLRDLYISAQTDPEYARMRNGGRAGELAQLLSHEFIQNYEHYAEERAVGNAFLIRYEDSIRDSEETTARIEQRFGLRFSLERRPEDLSGHTPSASLDTVERWRNEGLDEGAQRTILGCVGRELRDLGYAVEDLPAPVFEFTFSRECITEVFDQSPDGRLHLESDRARVEIMGTRYWLTLPLPDFDAASVDHIWLCVAQGPGNVCALDWSRGRPSGNAIFHVEHQPSADSRVLDFPLYTHPEWRGRIRQLRLHLFNLYQTGFNRRLSLATECQGTGYLRWLRAFKLG